MPDFRQALTPEWVPDFRQVLGADGQGQPGSDPTQPDIRGALGLGDRERPNIRGALGMPARNAEGLPDFHGLLGGAGGSFTSDDDVVAAFPVLHLNVAGTDSTRACWLEAAPCPVVDDEECADDCRCAASGLPWYERDSVVVDWSSTAAGMVGEIRYANGGVPPRATAEFCATSSARALLGE